ATTESGVGSFRIPGSSPRMTGGGEWSTGHAKGPASPALPPHGLRVLLIRPPGPRKSDIVFRACLRTAENIPETDPVDRVEIQADRKELPCGVTVERFAGRGLFVIGVGGDDHLDQLVDDRVLDALGVLVPGPIRIAGVPAAAQRLSGREERGEA